jgi:hypothetical protein
MGTYAVQPEYPSSPTGFFLTPLDDPNAYDGSLPGPGDILGFEYIVPPTGYESW